jgi:hypothetical protein
MKTNKLYISAAAIFTIATSCAKEENLSNDQAPQASEVQLTDAERKVLYQMRSENNQVTFEEATQLANDVIGFLDGEAAVKSGRARRIGSVTALCPDKEKRVALKSAGGSDIEMPDTAAYVFNFADSAGFALIAGDTRIESPILAYVDEGTLGAEIDNPGLAVFLEGTEEYIERSIVEAERMKDSLLSDITAKLGYDAVEAEQGTKAILIPVITSISYGGWETTSQVYPLLPVEWHQDAPFNQAVSKACTDNRSNGGRAPAGCVAIATAQLMAYWQHPSSIDGYSMSWPLLRSYTCRTAAYDNASGKIAVNATPATADVNARNFNTQVARLVERIGRHVDMDYGCGGSNATTSDAVEYLRALGYKYGVSGYFNEHWELGQGYSEGTVTSSLNSGKPVLTRGNSFKKSYLWGLINTYSGGHSWVVDGYVSRRRRVDYVVHTYQVGRGFIGMNFIRGYTGNTSYLHNNWGWGDGNNGYYVSGSFDANASHLDSNTKAGNAHNYQYKIQIFPHISK